MACRTDGHNEVLSALVFADVSGCGVKASIAGVDEGTSGDQVSIVPPRSGGLSGAPRPALHLFRDLFWGQWCCSCWPLVLTCLGEGSSSASCSLGWFESRVERGRWCPPVWGGYGLPAAAAAGAAGGSLPVTAMVTRKSKSALTTHHSLTAPGPVCSAAWVRG